MARVVLNITTGDHPRVLCVEPLGEIVELQPNQIFQVLSVGSGPAIPDIALDKDSIAVYPAIGADIALFHNGQPIAGLFPLEWAEAAPREYELWCAENSR